MGIKILRTNFTSDDERIELPVGAAMFERNQEVKSALNPLCVAVLDEVSDGISGLLLVGKQRLNIVERNDFLIIKLLVDSRNHFLLRSFEHGQGRLRSRFQIFPRKNYG